MSKFERDLRLAADERTMREMRGKGAHRINGLPASECNECGVMVSCADWDTHSCDIETRRRHRDLK